jgi:hypothetical protein
MDGTVIHKDGRVERMRPVALEVPSASDAQRQLARTRRTISDLPAPPKEMNAVSVVLFYTLFGMDDTQIALATDLTEKQIKVIKDGEAFGKMYATISEEIQAQDSDEVRRLFAAGARSSAMLMLETANDPSIRRDLRMVAAKDVLDRAGHQPKNNEKNKIEVDGELRIVVVKREIGGVPPTIDITPQVIEHGA